MMQRSLAMIAVALVASAAAFEPIVELDSGDCIVKGEELADNEFAVTLGACDDADAPAVAFEFAKQGSYLKTDEDLCLGAAENSKKNGTALVLGECDSKAKSQKWVLYENNVWKNGNKKCMTFDAEEDSLVQVNCDEEPAAFELDGCDVEPKVVPAPATSTTVFVTPTLAPTPTPVYTCANFATSVQPGNPCPYGYFVPSNYYTVVTTPATAVSQCCAPVPYRTCGQYSVQMGGPNNVCKSKYGDYELIENLNTKCSATDNKNCFQVCCEEVKPTTQSCRAFVASGSSYRPACPSNTQPIANLDNTFCLASNYHGDCVKACCESIPQPPAGNATCADWTAAGNRCPDLTISMPLITCTINMGIAGCDQNKCCSIPNTN